MPSEGPEAATAVDIVKVEVEGNSFLTLRLGSTAQPFKDTLVGGWWFEGRGQVMDGA